MPEPDMALLTLLRDVARATPDPQDERIPILELARSIRESALTYDRLRALSASASRS